MSEDKKKEKDPYALRDIYDEMELELITSMQHNLIKHKIDEYNAGVSWEMWQKAKLRNIIDYRRETNETLYRFAKRIKFAIRDVLEYHFHKGRNFKIKIPENGKNTAKVGEDPPNEDQFFGMNEKKLNALVESTTNDFKDIQQSVYRKMDDVYRQTIFKTAYQMASGTISLDKAIDKSVEGFLKKGIDCIVYKNGRHVNIADYAEMALRTASHRATLLGEGSKRDEMGVHLVFVSAHANACKLCLPWQGQILIDDVFSHPREDYIAKYKDKYKLLSDAIKAGLLHPNCRHTLATYFEGVTRLPKKQDPVQALKNYNNEQEQRRLEREIRKQKRIYAGVVDKADKKEASSNLRQAQKNLRDFLKEHPEFKRHIHREKIYDEDHIRNQMSSENKSDGNNLKIDDDLMHDIKSGIKAMNKDFPVFKELIDKVSFDQGTTKEYAYSETWRYNGKVTTTIKVGQKFSDKETLLNSISRDVNSHHTYSGMSPRSLIIHECTHALEVNMTLKEMGINAEKVTDKQWEQFRSRYGYISSEIKEQAMKNLGVEFMQPKWYKMYEELGVYAKNNSNEFLAQCISQVLTTDKPSDVALEVYRLLKERLK